jgi:hypothetical protein
MSREFLEQVVRPLVADEGDLDACYKLIEHRAVALLLERGLSADEIAAHLRRSRTWVYSVMGELKKEPESSDPDDREPGLKIDVMVYLASRRTTPLSVLEIAEHVAAAPARIVNLLAALRKLGVVESHQGKYRAVADLVKWRENENRKIGLLSAMATAFRMGSAYLGGEADILCDRIELSGISPSIWRRKLDLLRGAYRQLIQEAISESQRENPDGIGQSIQVKGFICIGKA